MTAVVGILNKDAIAIAADSAVTISGPSGTKILNSANKIFRLSKFHPVGLMIYNAASFMGTPWETIIKVYRSRLSNRSFDTLREYCDDFISFLREQNFFATESVSKSAVGYELRWILSSVVPPEVQEEIFTPGTPSDRKKEIINKIVEQVERKQKELSKSKTPPDFETLDREVYNNEIKVISDELLEEVFVSNGFTIEPEILDQIHALFHKYICSDKVDGSYTGLIFSGFGNLELYPHLIPINISFSWRDRLHYYIDDGRKAEITYTEMGVIRPFAQKDVMDTILTGIDPELEKIFTRNVIRFMLKFNDEILNQIGDSNPELRAKIESIDARKLIDQFVLSNRKAKSEFYINPLIGAIATLSKQDLAEMAESLVLSHFQ